MKIVLWLEELAMFLLGIYLFSQLPYSWWWFPVLLLTPDIGMLGYLVNSRVGALTYNLFHHKGIAILVFMAGVWMRIDALQLVGLILFAHASMDRMLGYGLKYSDSFWHTHLGMIRK